MVYRMTQAPILLAILLSACGVRLDVSDTITLDRSEKMVKTMADFAELTLALVDKRSSDDVSTDNEITIAVRPNATYGQVWVAASAATMAGYGSIQIEEAGVDGKLLADLSRSIYASVAGFELGEIPEEPEWEEESLDPEEEKPEPSARHGRNLESRQIPYGQQHAAFLALMERQVRLRIHLAVDTTTVWFEKGSAVGALQHFHPSDDVAGLLNILDAANQQHTPTDSTDYTVELTAETACPARLYFAVRKKVDGLGIPGQTEVADSGSLVIPTVRLTYPFTAEAGSQNNLVWEITNSLLQLLSNDPVLNAPDTAALGAIKTASDGAGLYTANVTVVKDGRAIPARVGIRSRLRDVVGEFFQERTGPVVFLYPDGIIVKKTTAGPPPLRPLGDRSLEQDLKWYGGQFTTGAFYDAWIPITVADTVPFSELKALMAVMLTERTPLDGKPMYRELVFDLNVVKEFN